MAKLGQLLVARGWITVQQLTRALQAQQVVGGRLGTCLLEMDAISEDNLLKGLSEHLGVPSASLDDLRGVPQEVLALIPDKLARRRRTIPFRVVGSRLDVVMLEPRDLASQDEIAFASGKRVMVHVSHELRILEALERYYREETPSRISLLVERLNRARYFWERDKPAANPAEKGLGDDLVRLPPLPQARPRPVPPAPLPPPPPAVRPVPPPPPPAPAAPAAAPVRKPAVHSISMTSEERAALVAAQPSTQGVSQAALQTAPQAAPAAAPSLPAPASIEEVEAIFAKTLDREEVARTALGFLAAGYKRAALFQVTKDKVAAWMGQGEMDLPIFQKFSVALDQPSLFLNLRNGSGLHMGPLPPMPAHRDLARAWGGDLPRDCVVLPVRVKDRLVAVLYADGGVRAPAAKGMGGVELSHLQRLAAAAGAALERCILHRKRVEAKP